MSGAAAKATRRDIRRAFGPDAVAVATVAALDTRLRQAEAEIVALRLNTSKLARLIDSVGSGLIGVEVNARQDRIGEYLID